MSTRCSCNSWGISAAHVLVLPQKEQPLLSACPRRILTGLAAAAAGAAAVALFVRGVARARRPTLAEAFPEQPYDRLSSWCPPKPRSLE